MFTSLYFDLKSFAMLYYIDIHSKRLIRDGCVGQILVMIIDKLRLCYSSMDNGYDNLGLCWANIANDNIIDMIHLGSVGQVWIMIMID